MIINDWRRFVFVHVPKSGGTSVGEVLGKLRGNNVRWLHPSSKHESLNEFRQRWRNRRTVGDALLHRSPEGYKSFGFVRHPWQRISSLYRYLKEMRPRPEIDRAPTLADFIRQAIDGEPWIWSLHSMRPQVELVGGDWGGGPAVEFLGYYETLAEDFAAAAKWLCIPQVQLPRRNHSSNSRVDYRRQFSDGMVDAVAKLFQRDIEAFGYQFDLLVPNLRESGRLRMSDSSAKTREASPHAA